MKALSIAVAVISVTATPSRAQTDHSPQPAAAPADQQVAQRSFPDAYAQCVKEAGSNSVKEAGPENGGQSDRSDGTQPPPGKTGTHMFGVLPNYATVENGAAATAITTRQKFRMASLNTFDPYVYPFVGAVATLNRTYGPGDSGYVKQYAASLTDNAVGNFLTSAVLPSALHQDPRYFERGSGGLLSRVAYAASRSVVTRGDAGRVQFNASEIAGNGIAAGLANIYYPAAERTITGTLSRWGLQVLWDTLSNELKEFWPDVRQRLHGR
jgi:hypothetical protein